MLMITWTFFLNYVVQFYLNNTVNLHPLTPHIRPSYTHKMANERIVTIDSLTSFHPIYTRDLVAFGFRSNLILSFK